jgi:hypothetical protein
VDVTVINPDGKSATSPKGFTYTSETPPPAQKDMWIVELNSESAESEAKVSFGVAQDATDDYDIDYDEGLPPPSPEHIPLILSFENELTPLKIDIRGPVTSNKKIITWTLNIDSEAQGKLIWNTKELPTGWSLNIESVDMRAVEEISFEQGRSTMTITAATPTDINSDGKVDISDLILVGRNFGEQGGEIEGDVNDDGVVNISDLALVAENFGIFLTP